MKKAFTLAEIMIVLSVIAIITAILLPSARNATPNENLMKFKKGHLAFVNVINELVNSEKYYLNGDLGIRPNDVLIDGTHDGDNTYFCETFADVLGNIKEKNCQIGGEYTAGHLTLYKYEEQFEHLQTYLDNVCSWNKPYEIKTTDNILYYQIAPDLPFGVSFGYFQQNYSWQGDMEDCTGPYYYCNNRLFYDNYKMPVVNTPRRYKIFCMDIDEFKKGESPFGYGIRTDGKIFFGKRATDWFKKTLQEK